MKQFLIIILFVLSSFASEGATKNDISEIRRDIRESNKIILEVMNKRFDDVNKRFEAVDKRFDDVNKRFEAVDKRFDDVNKRFENMQKYMDKRFENMQKSTDKRFEDMNKRFEDMQKYMNKRFDDVNKRFEDMNSKFNMIVTIMLAGFALIMGYLIKERNSIKKDVKEEVDKELDMKLREKADINLVERVVNVLEEYGKRNRDIANVLKKHNFIVK